ncbi:MAG TPA: hypothetical protein VI669_11990 [Vicinamibacteria bacterium]
MPARWVPLLYFTFAHACLATAFAEVALEPRSLAGFFYHPRMLAVVHLVTLGWISGSILGAIYVVGPLAFRMPLPARRADYFAFAGFAVGVVGMVSHFWMEIPAGMAWAAGLVACSMSYVAGRALHRLLEAPVPWEARLPMALAFVNMLAAAGLGVLVAVNKVSPFLTVTHLDVVLAHAHLAALGWGTMMVMGAGYRILPMILPAAMPRGRWLYASAGLLQGGLVGLFWAFFHQGRGLAVFGGLVVAGIGCFLSRVVWMLRNRRPAPTELRRPDWSVAHAILALTCLVAACGLGLYLTVAEASDTTLSLTLAYGATGLIGFLSQIIVGVLGRVLPLFAWLWGFSDRAYAEAPSSLHRAPARPLQALIFALWAAGVPLLTFGLATDRPRLFAAAGWALLVAVCASLANAGLVLWRLWRR